MHIIYGAFFRHVLALEDAAVQHDKEGRNGNEVRAYYQNVMKLTDAEAATVKKIARDCQNAADELEVKARKVIDAAWAPYPGHRVPVGVKPPALPDELRQLERERIETIKTYVQKMETALGPATFRKVDAHVQRVLAKRISIVPIAPPVPQAPPNRTNQ